MDSLMLARMQFACNISFHILFPSITIALAWILLFFKLRFNSTHNSKWLEAYKLYVKVFALSFALGVVSGITMSFQFGTNWPGFMNTVGNIAGPLLGYEVLTAFFLEATFLGVMLFGFNKVSNKTHTIATFLVAFGTTLSAFWIIVLNSWMNTPQGFEMRDGVAYATNWLEIIFNPSMPYRLIHMLIASGLTASFLIAGLSAYQLQKKDQRPAVFAGLKTGIYLAGILIPLQIFIGDLHGLNTLKHYPQKISAMEGIWQTQKGAPLLLFAIPNQELRNNSFEIAIPKLSSLILTHDFNGEIKGLNDFAEHPKVLPVFMAFRVMVGVGILMLVVAWFSLFQILRKKNLPTWLQKVLIAMTFSGWLATLAGWYTTEIGRQPWLVKGILLTSQASSNIPSKIIGSTLTIYVCVYLVLIFAYIATIFYLAKNASIKLTPNNSK